MLSRRGRALPLAGRSLALCGQNPFEAITLSPGQAHHRITPVTQHTTTTTPTPMMPDSNRDHYMLEEGGDSRGKSCRCAGSCATPFSLLYPRWLVWLSIALWIPSNNAMAQLWSLSLSNIFNRYMWDFTSLRAPLGPRIDRFAVKQWPQICSVFLYDRCHHSAKTTTTALVQNGKNSFQTILIFASVLIYD